jgi:OOP family OmpA-OmpF porin
LELLNLKTKTVKPHLNKPIMKATFYLICLMLFLSYSTNAQIDVRGKIKNKSINRADQHTDNAIDNGLDKAEEGVGNLFKKDKKNDSDNEQTTKDDNSKDNSQEGSNVKSTQKQDEPKLESYSKYDFVPGEKVIFFDDFSQDNVGDFPALWNTNGSAEVVTTNLFPGNWMRFSCQEAIWTDELLKLPDNYTIEFDIIPIKNDDGEMAGYNFLLIQSVNAKSLDAGAVPGNAGFRFNTTYSGIPYYYTYINTDEGDGLWLDGSKDGDQYLEKENQKYHVAIWVQKSRVRFYLGENKLFDLPKAFPLASVKMDRIRFENGAAMVSNVRIAVGTPDMRSKLLTEGKLISYGIYFDVNKDVVKPESYGTLKGIAQVLTDNPNVKIKIVGHTDSDGADAANLDLSERRGASVKNELIKTFGIDDSRIETDGKGETEPIAPNDTPSNKALNRRVEFIKL